MGSGVNICLDFKMRSKRRNIVTEWIKKGHKNIEMMRYLCFIDNLKK